jgi:hypothetical protein
MGAAVKSVCSSPAATNNRREREMLKVKETACGHHQELAASRASYSTFNYNQQIPHQTSRLLLLLLLLLSSFLLAAQRSFAQPAAPRGGKESNKGLICTHRGCPECDPWTDGNCHRAHHHRCLACC